MRNWSTRARSRRLAFRLLVLTVSFASWVLCAGCDDGRRTPGALVSPEDTASAQERRRWVNAVTAEHDWHVRAALLGTRDIQYDDGWYPSEFDPKAGGSWRWMERHAVVRLRTRVEGQDDFRDMSLTVHGWVPPREDMATRTSQMDFAINGHVLEHMDPPREAFAHTIVVPKWLLEHSEFVDFAITVANTAQPRGDWRDIGFCTTGVIWKPSSAS